ncbi:MAG: EamA family transporter [Succinivibrio sp.]|nr:EamA family transporter [Succinivibrio sp.]
MLAYVWPLALVILANTFYNICAKSFPAVMNPLAALTVTYLVAAVVSLLLYYCLKDEKSQLLLEYSRLNWVPFAFGLALVGLEMGFIYVYKAGWPVSTAFIITSAFLAIILLVVGYVLYKEPISWNKVVGIGICLVGLWVLNR